jgi:hypothetical protein
MASGDWINLLLIAAKDIQVLIVTLFFLGLGLVVASMGEIPLGGSKFGVKPENQKKAFLSGISITVASGLILAALLVNSMGVEVSGTVKYSDGRPVRDTNVFIGTHLGRTNAMGYYEIDDVQRNESQVTVIIKDKHSYDTVDIPGLYWKKKKDITILPINLSIYGEVVDEERKAVEEAWVNISSDKVRSEMTDTKGEFNFGKQEVPFVTPKPLTLFVQLPDEPIPRNKEVLEIPKEEPYIIYRPITLRPKDYVDVSGRVILKHNYTDRTRMGMPDVIVSMDQRTALSEDDGSYTIKKVPINAKSYLIMSADGKILANHTLPVPLRESDEIPRKRDLPIYESEVINASVGR